MIYKLGHIYAIWDCEDHNLIYYGSTKNLEDRIKEHKKRRNACTSKKIIERGNYEYTILESHENIDEYDLVERERWYIENKVCVNKHIPHRTKAEWYEDNKEKIAKQKIPNPYQSLQPYQHLYHLYQSYHFTLYFNYIAENKC